MSTTSAVTRTRIAADFARNEPTLTDRAATGAWNQAQSARLKHTTFQLTADQLAVVSRALEYSMVQATAVVEEASNPNQRGNALYHLSRAYLETLEEPATAYTWAYTRLEAEGVHQ